MFGEEKGLKDDKEISDLPQKMQPIALIEICHDEHYRHQGIVALLLKDLR